MTTSKPSYCATVKLISSCVCRQVDIFQMSVIEFKDRPGKPLYHLENFIEGEYIKYNSNSGFVDESHRCTPQAFSHFTFERSGHTLIVVDIQGVGDLWTDPQVRPAWGVVIQLECHVWLVS